jgi:hypothetical protein
MIDLNPASWKAVAVKFKIKDNGLERALASYDKLADDAHDECLKAIATVTQLANTLKRAKEVVTASEAVKYLNGLTSCADHEKSEVTKAQAAAQKAQEAADKAKAASDKAQQAADKAKAAADKAEADAKKKDEGETEAQVQARGDYKDLLLSLIQKVKTAKDVVYKYIICDTKPHVGVMIARQIGPGHKAMLTKLTGGKKFTKINDVTFENGHLVFAADDPFQGGARRIQESLTFFVGKKIPLIFGGEHAADDETGGAAGAEEGAAADAAAGAGENAAGAAAGGRFAISGSVGRGGKNNPQDVQAVQTALNAKINAGLSVNGKCDAATIKAIMALQQNMGKFKPDGLVEVGRGTARALASNAKLGPAPEPPQPKEHPKLGTGTLDSAPDAWRNTLQILEHNFGEVKRCVRSDYKEEHPTLLKDIEKALAKLDKIVETLGTDIAEMLEDAKNAKSDAARKAKLQACVPRIAQQINFVKSDPTIALADKNPYIQLNCRQALTNVLLHVAQGVGKVNG